MIISKINNEEEIKKAAYSAVGQLLSTTKCATHKDFEKLAEQIIKIADNCVIAKDFSH